MTRKICLQSRPFPCPPARRSVGDRWFITGDWLGAAHRTGLSGKPVSGMPGFGGSPTAAIPVDAGPGGKRYRASGEVLARRATRGRCPARAACIPAQRSVPADSPIEAQVQVEDRKDPPCLPIPPQSGALDPGGVSLVRVRDAMSGGFQPAGWVSASVKRCIYTSSRGFIPYFATL
jgi:hypothetical protein